MLRRSLLAIALTLLMSVSLAGPASADMTKADAGAYYLSAVCPGNKAIDRLAKAMFGKKKVIRARHMKGKRLKRTRQALAVVDRTHSNGATRLLNAPDAWPSEEAQFAAEDMAYAMLEYSDAASHLAKLRRGAFIDYYANEFTWANDETVRLSRIARAELGLPGVGRGCK